MAKLSTTEIFGKLKATGEAIISGVLRVKNGIKVEGSEDHQFAGIRAGSNADSGHLMLDSNGGNLYLNWEDSGEIRLDSYTDYGGNEVADRGWVGNNYNNYTDSDAQSAVSTYGNWTIEEGDGEQTNIYSGQKLEIYGGGDITTEIKSTGGQTRLRVQHANTSNQSNVTTGGATVIDDIYLNNRGHVTNMNTQNRSIDNWNNSGNASNNNVDADEVDGYDITKNGGGGSGIIDFQT